MENDEENVAGLNGLSTLRRSLRQMNPFKNKFFRLPATPRLSRNRKTMGKGEEPTSWNFERPLSTTNINSSSNHQNQGHNGNLPNRQEMLQYQQQQQQQTQSQSNFVRQPSQRSEIHRMESPCMPSMPQHSQYDYRNEFDNISLNYNPPVNRLTNQQPPAGGSCRLSNRSSRPPLPSFNPPNAREAEYIIHEHMRNLMSSASSTNNSKQQFLFLPNTSYAPSGEIYDAQWQAAERNYYNESPMISPTHSTISLINTQTRVKMRPTTKSVRQENRSSLRPSYQLNGLFHHSSLKSLNSVDNGNISQIESISSKKNIRNPLFSLLDVTTAGEAESAFLGREWVFKELYQMVVIEHTRFTLIHSASGCGKTSILRQLVLQSSFFTRKNGNGDTVDSGIVVGSLDSTLSSRNYEWLKAIAGRIVAYHNCRFYSSLTCSIPEFVRNLALYMASSPMLSTYGDIIRENKELLGLLESDTACLEIDPVSLFTRLITEPLKRVIIPEDECAVVLIDALDEADFHRNESGESIAWLLAKTYKELPKWLRFVVSSSSFQVLCDLPVRTVHIDDAEFDQRVLRDIRILIDYRITISPQLEQGFRLSSDSDDVNEIVEKLVHLSRGSMLYIQILLDLIEQNGINIKSTCIGLLPNDLSQLYLLLLNYHFKSLTTFCVVKPIISVVIASLRALTFADIHQIVNAAADKPTLTESDLRQRLIALSPFIVKLNNDTYVPLHPSFREWVLKNSASTDYAVDIRLGHILHALAIVRKGSAQSEQLFELGHHLLKANPYKYMPPDVGTDMPNSKDCHIAWIHQAAQSQSIIKKSLLWSRNLYYSNTKLSKLLLLAGASPNEIWPDGNSLIASFAMIGNTAMVTLLISFGADVNSINQEDGMTPLMLATKNGHIDTVQVLLDNGADIMINDKNNNCVLTHAAVANSVPLISYLLEREFPGRDAKKKRTQRNEYVRQAFEAAARVGSVRICEFLLDCTDCITDTSTAMCIACSSGQSETVQFLLSRGATLSANNFWHGKSALICAIESGSWDLVVNVLNSSNLDLNKDHATEEGWTPLIVAVRHGHVGLVDLLINRGADMNVKDKEGNTAIMHTIICRHASTAALLIDKRCDLSVRDNQGNGLIHLLAIYCNKCIIDRLLEQGLSLEDKNNEGMRPVEVAIKNQNHNAVEIFLRRGARLRTLTWRIAVNYDTSQVLILLQKLLDDAAILFRRKRTTEAFHRFEYALEKCNELLEENSITPNAKLSPIVTSLKNYKLRIILAMASVKRRSSQINEALELIDEGLLLAENDDMRFDFYLCRAKCFFDNQNLVNAKADAELAASIRPDNADVQNLLSVFKMPLSTAS